MKATQSIFWCSWDHQDTQRFRGEEQYRPCGILSETIRAAKLETSGQSWKTLDSDGACVRIPMSRLLRLSHSRRKIHLHGTLETRHTQVLNTTTKRKRALKQLTRYLKGTQHTWLRLEPREMVQTGLLELVGRSDSDWAGDSATRQSVRAYHCDLQHVTICNRRLKQTATCLTMQPVFAPASCWDFQFVSKWIETRQDTFCSAEDQADSNTVRYDACPHGSG